LDALCFLRDSDVTTKSLPGCSETVTIPASPESGAGFAVRVRLPLPPSVMPESPAMTISGAGGSVFAAFALRRQARNLVAPRLPDRDRGFFFKLLG